MNLALTDTVAAIITPHGKGGVGIIRISGGCAFEILKRIAPSLNISEMQPQRLVLTDFIVAETGALADRGFAVIFKKPNSFTGEDCVEIHGHGGEMNMRRLLALVLKCGARVARNGEFTMRAFLNGKIDLAQAEAVLEMVEANSLAALNSAALTLEGALSKKIREVREKLLDVLYALEGEIDFPDDIDGGCPALNAGVIESVLADTRKFIELFNDQRILHSAIRVPIVGKPNAGKSSVFNALLGYPRAIICEEPGTTRDFISESLYFEDFFVSLMDTAGIRKTGDFIESEGVSRAKRLIEESPLAIAVFDSAVDFDENDLHLLSILKRDATLFVLNKADISGGKPRYFPDLDALNPLRISALRGDGIEDLRASVAQRIRDLISPLESPFMINERQHDVLKRLDECLSRLIKAVKQEEPAEISAEELRRAVSITNEITGDDITEEILERIFSRFCVGK